MKNYQIKNQIESILNDKTSLVSYENFGFSISFEFAQDRKEEIIAKADLLKKSFSSVDVKGRKYFTIEITK